MDKLLERLLGEDIHLITSLDTQLGHVHIDQGSIEQVILNLALNARDAMPKGGRITIRTSNVDLRDDNAPTNCKVAAGPYVVLAVSDEGAGMSPEIMTHIFEPFFTTKGNGKGTGLGLATVYGIVKQSGGDISVESKLRQGSVFKIYLPRVKSPSDSKPQGTNGGEAPRGSETILVAEDEDIVRKVVVRALRKKGYTVLPARSGPEAILISAKHSDPIHLLLTDVIMPGMNGRELAESMAPKRPGMATLYMSAYNQEIIAQRGVLAPGTALIEKSFSSEGICQKVREVLDTARGKAS
jgi:two-component system cell cycle sensor histidine kinase/response regulator CckA